MNYSITRFFSSHPFLHFLEKESKGLTSEELQKYFSSLFSTDLQIIKTHTSSSVYKQKASFQPETHLILQFSFILLIQQTEFSNCEGMPLFSKCQNPGLESWHCAQRNSNIYSGMASCTTSVGLSRPVKFGITFDFSARKQLMVESEHLCTL